jgi:hypothetical protein
MAGTSSGSVSHDWGVACATGDKSGRPGMVLATSSPGGFLSKFSPLSAEPRPDASTIADLGTAWPEDLTASAGAPRTLIVPDKHVPRGRATVELIDADHLGLQYSALAAYPSDMNPRTQIAPDGCRPDSSGSVWPTRFQLRHIRHPVCLSCLFIREKQSRRKRWRWLGKPAPLATGRILA